MEILAVSVDPHDKALLTREKLKDNPGFNFPLLSDPDHRVIDRYGLLNDKAQRPIPHPTTLVIDRKGVVRWRFTEVDYRVRPSNEDILKEIAKIEATGSNPALRKELLDMQEADQQMVATLSAYVVAQGKDAAPAHSVLSTQHGESGSKARRLAPAGAKAAPDFTLKDIAGNEVKLSDYKDKVVVINFWATWCGPCRLETPWLVELREQYHEQGFEIIGVSVDSFNEYDPAEVSAFTKKYKVSYPIVMATKEMFNAFGPVTGLPTTLVIDRQGKIRHRHRGLISFDDLKEKVVSLL